MFDLKEKMKMQPAYKVIDPRKEPLEDKKEDDEGERETIVYPILPVQEILPVKEIYKGMIITTDDRYIKILEVLPINFALRSQDEQDNIIFLFASWLRIAPVKFQIKVITRRADTREIINNVRLATQNETQPKCIELTENYINFIQEVSGSEALSRRFFIIYEYEPNSSRIRTLDEVAFEMEEMARKIRNGLAACGNEVFSHTNEDFFQGEALYLFYNKRSAQKVSFADRVIRVTNDIMQEKGLTPGVDPYPDVHITNYICPRGVEFTHKDYFICDGTYNTILYVPRDGFPTTVRSGWISTLVESTDGVDVDLLFHKIDRATVKNNVALKLKLNRIKANERNDTDTDYEEIEDAINASSYIKQGLANGEDYYDMHAFVTVSASTHEALIRRKEAIVDALYSRDIVIKDAYQRMEEAFQVTAPLLNENASKELMTFSKRNVMTFGAASMYPFTSCELCDEKGIVLGINRRYSSLVNLDIFNTKKYKNANMAILGTSGSGKTFCTLTMALRMRMQGIQTFIIAPDKAHEFQRACVHIGGSYIRISPGAKSCINLMEIHPVVNPIAEFLDESDSAESDSWLAQKTTQLLTFFHILMPELTNEEEQLVDEAIIKTYNRFNITHDNESIYLPGTKKVRPMPIIGDLYETLRENPDTRRVANILGRFVTGSASSFNQQTNVDLKNKFIIFDLQDLQGNMKAVGMFIVMDFLWSRIKENRTDKKALFIDEGWQLIGASTDTRAADFVYRIFKIIRGYGGAAIFATQDLSDLFSFQDGKYGKAIISNSKIKIILGLEPQEARSVREVLQLTKNELRSIVNFNRGEALLCANNNKMEVFIRASKLEEELITTDPAQLRAIVDRAKRQKQEDELAKHMSMSAYQNIDDADDFDYELEDIETLSDNAHTNMLAMDQLAETDGSALRESYDASDDDIALVSTEKAEEVDALNEVFVQYDTPSAQNLPENIESVVSSDHVTNQEQFNEKKGKVDVRNDNKRHPPIEF